MEPKPKRYDLRGRGQKEARRCIPRDEDISHYPPDQHALPDQKEISGRWVKAGPSDPRIPKGQTTRCCISTLLVRLVRMSQGRALVCCRKRRHRNVPSMNRRRVKPTFPLACFIHTTSHLQHALLSVGFSSLLTPVLFEITSTHERKLHRGAKRRRDATPREEWAAAGQGVWDAPRLLLASCIWQRP